MRESQSINKRAKLLALALLRQKTRWAGHKGIGDYSRGEYECNFVSPFTKSAHNVDADVFIVLQDWSSDDSLRHGLDKETVQLGHTPRLPTNRNLKQLLNRNFGLDLSETYATNLFPFVKMGAMNASIPQSDLVRAATEFAIPQIEIVCPKLVICLGLVTFRAIQRTCKLPLSKDLNTAVNSSFLHNGIRVYCQAHTGALGQINRKRLGSDQVEKDWLEMSRSVGLHPSRRARKTTTMR